MQPNDELIDTPDNDPDDEEVILSFDKLREAFAQLEGDKASDADFAAGFVRFGENSQTPVDFPDDNIDDNGDVDTAAEPEIDPVIENAPENTVENDLDENGEPYESIAASEAERCELSPRTIFEAMLFVGDRDNKPLTPQRAAEQMRNVSPDELVEIVHELNAAYARVEAPYHIVPEDDGYRMVLRPEFEDVRSRFYSKTRETKLSQAAIDVLAIVAYKQPVTADEVQKYRKSSSQPILQQLVKRGLIDTQKILSEKKTVTLFRTTDRFLQLFQINSLDELPTVEEIDFR